MQLFLQSAYLSSVLSVVYIALLYRSHQFRRLPVASILSTFVVGMLCVVPVLLVYRIFPALRGHGLAGAVVIAPLVEEAVKLTAFLLTTRRLGYPHLVDALDYAIFYGTLGVGFAIYEDFWYIFGSSYASWISGDRGRFLEVFRWMAYARSFPGHVLFNAMAGLVLGWGLCHAPPERRGRWMAGGFLTAFSAHALFNLAAQARGTLLLWSLVVLLLGIYLALRRRALKASPFSAIQRMVRGEPVCWAFDVTPVETLFAEGFSWPDRARSRLLSFYPLTFSLLVLFPLLVSCVYFLHRLLSIGVRS